MSNMIDIPFVLTRADSIGRGSVLQITKEGLAQVQLHGTKQVLECAALESSWREVSSMSSGDEVLVWLEQPESGVGVILGRIRRLHDPAAKPKTLLLESEEDIVIRNKYAKIKISAAGDIEIVGKSLISRSQRLLRLLAPLIKLN
jgi:hypothetical protein